MTVKTRKHETIGCCGIDCGLCPRYYTNGRSRCGGCGGRDFQGSCGVLTCCAIKKEFDVCAECEEYPCQRLNNAVKFGCDTFTTREKICGNIVEIKADGLELFLEQQKIRVGILEDLLANHDDGRRKGLYCISCTLLPIEKLQEVHKVAQDMAETVELKERCKQARTALEEVADSMSIELKPDKNK